MIEITIIQYPPFTDALLRYTLINTSIYCLIQLHITLEAIYCYPHFTNEEIEVRSKASDSFRMNENSTEINAKKKSNRTGLKNNLQIHQHEGHCESSASEERDANLWGRIKKKVKK